MGNAWFRMYVDFLDDAKMMALSFEDQRHFVAVLALKSAGTLEQQCKPELLDRIVAQKLWIDLVKIGEVKTNLIDAGLIGDDWQPLAWDKRQFRSDHDVTGAERQRRFREKQRNALRNGPVTLPDTDTDTDTELSLPNGSDVPQAAQREQKTTKKFTKPTAQELRTYCDAKNFGLDGLEAIPDFLDYYESKGWLVGKTPMRSWPHAFSRWVRGNETRQRNHQRKQSAGQNAADFHEDLKRIAAESANELGDRFVRQAAGAVRLSVVAAMDDD